MPDRFKRKRTPTQVLRHIQREIGTGLGVVRETRGRERCPHRAAHSLNGAARIFNWKALALRARTIEDAAATGKLDDARAGIPALEKEYAESHGALQSAVERLKAGSGFGI